MKNVVKFAINDSSTLKMILPFDEKELHCCIDIPIFLETNGQEYLLSTKDVDWVLDFFEILFSEALQNKCSIHESIKNDIGYLWNEELEGKGDLPIDENTKLWVGQHNLLMNSKEFATWLYNENNEIYLKVTPVYKWDSDSDSLMDDDYISYDEFIKNYKPIFTIKVDKKCAERVLKKTLELQAIINSNLQKLHAN